MCLQLFQTLFVNLQVEKGKLHGSIDVGLSVMAIKKKSKCIDLDAEENIYHLKVKTLPTSLPEVIKKKTRINQIIPIPEADIKMTSC